jgi:hypothetical protein
MEISLSNELLVTKQTSIPQNATSKQLFAGISAFTNSELIPIESRLTSSFHAIHAWHTKNKATVHRELLRIFNDLKVLRIKYKGLIKEGNYPFITPQQIFPITYTAGV